MFSYGHIVHLAIRFLDVTQFTTVTPLLLLIPLKLLLSVVSLKITPIYFDNKVSLVYTLCINQGFKRIHFLVSLEAVLHIITFIRSWAMRVQNNDIIPAISWHYIPHAVTRDSTLGNADIISLYMKYPIPNSRF